MDKARIFALVLLTATHVVDGRRASLWRLSTDASEISRVPACMWRRTWECSPNGTREPTSDKLCSAVIPTGHSGFCDCDGSGVKDDDDPGYDCATTPGTCAEACKRLRASSHRVYVSRAKPGEVLFITRQGQPVATRRADEQGQLEYNFTDDDVHKEFVASLETEHARENDITAFVKRGDLCGVGLFTQPKLQCSAASSALIGQTVQKNLRALDLPSWSNRGFGVELELVARTPPLEFVNMAKKAGRLIFGAPWTPRWLSNDAADSKNVRRTSEEIATGVNMTVALPAVAKCFRNATSGSLQRVSSSKVGGSPCQSHADCNLKSFCLSCADCNERKTQKWRNQTGMFHRPSEYKANRSLSCSRCSKLSADARICRHRRECKPGDAVEATCPRAVKEWTWTFDPTVRPLSRQEAEAITSGLNESVGVGFELISAGPPSVLFGRDGIHSTLEVMELLRYIGVQAGTSSGLHVHVNVASEKAPGRQMTIAQIASVWAAFAKYQLVIDEMLAPSRAGNLFARRLFFGNEVCDSLADDCEKNPCVCARRFFRQIHAQLRELQSQSKEPKRKLKTKDFMDFCNAALDVPWDEAKPCQERYSDQRYYALNLASLGRLGTVEFRAHQSSNDPVQVARWIQFVVAFTEYFGTGTVAEHFQNDYFSGDANEDLKKLTDAQWNANAPDLFGALRKAGLIDAGAEEWYLTRAWEHKPSAVGCGLANDQGETDLDKQSHFHESQEMLRDQGAPLTFKEEEST